MKKRQEFEFSWGCLSYDYAAKASELLPLDRLISHSIKCSVCDGYVPWYIQRIVLVTVTIKQQGKQPAKSSIIFARHKLCYCTYCDVLTASLNNLKKCKSDLGLSNHELLVIWKDIKPHLTKITKQRTTKIS